MLDYVARRPAVAKRGSSPNAMLMIIGVHVAALAALMSAKMDLPERILDPPIMIDFIHAPKPPPVDPPSDPRPSNLPLQSHLTKTEPVVATAPSATEIIDSSPQIPNFGALIKPAPQPTLARLAPPSAAQLITPASELKPLYPRSKLLSEEQAVVRLRLTIDERGRVIAVEAVGRADPAFLESARRHILARWRYRPASEGGQAIVSSAVVTLHFQIDG